MKRKAAMNKLLSVEIKGKEKNWSFNFYGDPKYLDEWRGDGLEINEICNTIPLWIYSIGLTRFWIFMQDLFNFKFLKR